jgi:hypothetical protein
MATKPGLYANIHAKQERIERQKDAGKTPEQAKSMLKAWEASGLFKIEEYHDPEVRKKRNKYVVDTDKLLEMKSQVRVEATPHD